MKCINIEMIVLSFNAYRSRINIIDKLWFAEFGSKTGGNDAAGLND